MTAMNWLATQLAWEQRLAELRGDGPAKPAQPDVPEPYEAREAA